MSNKMGPYNPSIGLQSISILIGCINFLAGLSVFVTLINSRRLKTRTNYLILNLTLTSILFELVIAIAYHINNIMYNMEHIDVTVQTNCNFLRLFNVLILLVCSFANIVAFDWYLTNHKTQYIAKFDRLYKYVIIAVYLMNLMGYGMSFMKNCEAIPYMVYVAYFMSVLQTVAFNIMSVCKEPANPERQYSLLAASLTIYFCLPYFVSDVYVKYMHTQDYNYFARWLVHVTQLVLQWPIYYIPLTIAFVLLKRCADFKPAFDKVVKRRKTDTADICELESCTKMEGDQTNGTLPSN